MPSNVDDTDYQKESPEAQSWLKYQVDAELQRISEQGSRAIPLPVKNMGVVVEPKPNKKSLIVINRIEIGTGMDFNRIKQIMVSEPKPYPFNKTGSAEYVHVLLFTGQPIPLLVPYVYAKQVQHQTEDSAITATLSNSLKEWLLINEKGARSRHSIDDWSEPNNSA